MNRPDVLAFVFLAGTGFGLLLALVALWLASRVTGEQLRQRQPDPVMAGLEVRDSSMGEFDAVARGAA